MAHWRRPWLRLWLVLLGLLGPAAGRTVADQLEREVGRSVRDALRFQYGFLEDPLLGDWLDRVGQPIARLVPRQDYPYVFYVIDTDAVNALAAPGCFIFVTKGLLDTVRSDDELAGVLAHELGHESERHAWRLIGHELPWIAGGQLLSGHLGDLLSLGLSVAHALDSLGFSRHLENRADRFGLEYAWRAGYDPAGILGFFEVIRPKKPPSKLASYFRTHQPTHERMEAARRSEWADQRDPSNLRHIADNLYANLRLRVARERYSALLNLSPDDGHAASRIAAIDARWARPRPEPAAPQQAAAASALRQAANRATEREQSFGPRFERFRAEVARVERERATMRALDALVLANPKATDWQWLTAFAQARELVLRLERALHRAATTRTAAREALAEVRLLANEATGAAAGQEIAIVALNQFTADLGAAAERGGGEWMRGLEEAAKGLRSAEAGMQVMELALLDIADPADWQPRRLTTLNYAALQTALFAARAHADEATVRGSAGYRATVAGRLRLAGLRLRLRALTQTGREAVVAEVVAKRLNRPRELVAFLLKDGRALDDVVWTLALANSTGRSPFAILDEPREGEDWLATASRLGTSTEAVRLIIEALRHHLEDALPA